MRKIYKKIAQIIATVFYIGYFPIAPGTIGSLLGALIYYLLRHNHIAHLIISIILVLVGWVCADIYVKSTKNIDPHEIVIDELSAVFIVYLFIPFSIKLFIIGFVLYRLFDIIKPPPIKNLENLRGGLGVIADDIMAAVYTNLLLHIMVFLKI